MKNICVFCGASMGFDPLYRNVATETGKYLADNNLRLIYGGGNVGLMGIVADAVLANGGEAVGIIPDFLQQLEIAHDGLTETIITETMHQRKTIMAERSDAVITLPGGFGSMDELFEMLTWKQLHLHQKPIGLLNVAGFYDPLLAMVDKMVETGFLREENRQLLFVSDTLEGLFTQFKADKPIFIDKWVDLEKS